MTHRRGRYNAHIRWNCEQYVLDAFNAEKVKRGDKSMSIVLRRMMREYAGLPLEKPANFSEPTYANTAPPLSRKGKHLTLTAWGRWSENERVEALAWSRLRAGGVPMPAHVAGLPDDEEA